MGKADDRSHFQTAIFQPKKKSEAKKAGLNHLLKLKIPTGWPRMFSQGVRANIRWRPSHRNLMETKALMEIKSKDWCWLPEIWRHSLTSK
jgi:hypothetical protein